MPTILFIYGWRLFFYSNEGTEPIHIHSEKADMEGGINLFQPKHINIKLEFIAKHMQGIPHKQFDFENILGEFVDSEELIKAIYHKEL
jgi:hypothetical protein